jgi:acetyl-CoA C-acetyltransferase
MATTWTVDQASALLFCTAETAERHRVPRSQWLFPLVAVECNHVVPVSARANLTQPAAMACLAEAADRHLGFPPGSVDLVDLYSCFPVAVEAAAEGLGIGGDRDQTVTGGMSFAGGPYNNYVFQATARMAELLQGGVGACGLVSCVSGLYTKVGFTVLGVAPPSQPFSVHDVTADVARLEPAVPIDDSATGTGGIAAYTVLYEHGEPERAVAVIDLANLHRAVGRSSHPEVIRALLDEEGVGRQVSLDRGVFVLGAS